MLRFKCKVRAAEAQYRCKWPLSCLCFLELYILPLLSYHKAFLQLRKPGEYEHRIWSPLGHACCGLVGHREKAIPLPQEDHVRWCQSDMAQKHLGSPSTPGKCPSLKPWHFPMGDSLPVLGSAFSKYPLRKGRYPHGEAHEISERGG